MFYINACVIHTLASVTIFPMRIFKSHFWSHHHIENILYHYLFCGKKWLNPSNILLDSFFIWILLLHPVSQVDWLKLLIDLIWEKNLSSIIIVLGSSSYLTLLISLFCVIVFKTKKTALCPKCNLYTTISFINFKFLWLTNFWEGLVMTMN